VLAQELLLRDNFKYLIDYMTGACYSFDTRLASGRIQIPEEVRHAIHRHALEQVSIEHDEHLERIWELITNRFAPKSV
jgi:hypothetical protein